MGVYRIAGGASLFALLLPACVSQAKYDEALEDAKLYQRMLHDLEQYQPELEAKYRRAEEELELLRGSGVVEADAFHEDIDARMAELQELLATMGRAPDDVTLFEVEGGYGFSVKDSVLFDSASEKLRDEGREVLLGLAGELASDDFFRLWVRGHTDSDPVVRPETLERFPHGNLQLSTARALEVASLLTGDGGVPRDRVAVAGFGPNEPIATNETAEGKQRNRRVEIFVIEEDPGRDR